MQIFLKKNGKNVNLSYALLKCVNYLPFTVQLRSVYRFRITTLTNRQFKMFYFNYRYYIGITSVSHRYQVLSTIPLNLHP